MMLAMLFMWDAVIGSFMISNDINFLKTIEYYALYVFLGAFLTFLLLIVIWFFKLFLAVKYFQNANLKAYKKNRSNKTTYLRAING